MSAVELKHKAQKRETKAKISAVFSIILGFVLCAFFARTAATAHDPIPRIGLCIISLWCLYFAYQAYKWVWPSHLEPDATLATTLRSYRSELEKRRDYARHIWRRAGLTFCFLGLAMVVVPGVIQSFGSPRMLLNFAPVLVLCAAWLLMFLRLRKRNERQLRQEIDELALYESLNPTV